jgi:hypothetical protein
MYHRSTSGIHQRFIPIEEGKALLLNIHELQYGSPKVQAYQPIVAEQARQDAIDLLKESMDIAIARSARYQQTFQ